MGVYLNKLHSINKKVCCRCFICGKDITCLLRRIHVCTCTCIKKYLNLEAHKLKKCVSEENPDHILWWLLGESMEGLCEE